MLKKLTLICSLFFAFALVEAAEDDLLTQPSSHAVGETMDRLEKAVRAASLTVFTRIDHAQGAESVGMQLRPSQLLIFGNPKLGTRLMQQNPRIGIDLPLKALVWEDDGGAVWLAYTDPDALFERFSVKLPQEARERMASLLERLSRVAAEP